jgi:hypothetical protein
MRLQRTGLGALALTYLALTACGGGGGSGDTVGGSSGGSGATSSPPLSITPASITITAGSGQAYTFSGQNGASGYKYAVLSGPGSINSSGIYTAGVTSGKATVQVTDTAGATATATVTSVFVRTNGPVYSAVTDGTNWYLGGRFSAVNAYEAPKMSVINTNDGTPNLGCDLQQGFDGSVYAVISDGQSVYVGGGFTHYRGTATPGGLVRIDPSDCHILSVYISGTGSVAATHALALQGSWLYAIVLSQTGLLSPLKINATTGVQDSIFIPDITNLTGTNNGIPGPYGLVATATDVYAGPFKFNAVTGVHDPAFTVFGNQPFQISGYVLSGSSLYATDVIVNGLPGIAKVDANTGALDPSFAPQSFDGHVFAALVSGNALYVCGDFTHYGTQQRLGVAKLDATTGALDPQFVPAVDFSGSNNTYSSQFAASYSLVMINGALYVGGGFIGSGGTRAFGLAKLDPATAAIDTTFTQPTGFNGAVNTLVSIGTNLFVGGDFSTYRGTPVNNVAKLAIADGAAPAAFANAPGPDGPVNAMLLENGALYLGGKFQHYGGTAAANIAKIDTTTGAIDTAFNQGTGPGEEQVSSLATDGSWLYVAGQFFEFGPTQDTGLAQVSLIDGTPTIANYGLTQGIGATAYNGGYVYMVGDGGLRSFPYSGFARFDATDPGTLDTGFPLLQSDGNLTGTGIAFVGNSGYVSLSRFVAGSGNAVSDITKFDATTGAVDTNFAVSPNIAPNPIVAILPLSSSLYTIAGDFLLKVDPTSGTSDTTFSEPTSTTNGSMRVLSTTGSDLWVGGDFTQYRGGRGYNFIPVNPATGAAADP